MFGMKEKINNFSKLSPKRKIAALILFAVFAFIPFVDSSFFHGQLLSILWIFDLVMIAFLLSVILVLAAFAIMESLVEVAAGLSLLIFLAQSYCAVPSHTIAGDNALKGLLGVGLVYVSYYFLRSLYKSLSENLKKIEDKKWSWEKILFVVLFLIFTTLLAWDIYQIVQPIISNLCVYK